MELHNSNQNLLRQREGLLYLRVSTPRQVVDGQSLSQQDEAIRQKVERNNWIIRETFSDEGVSGRIDRDGFEAAIRFAEENLKENDFFAVYNISRFARNVAKGTNARDRLKEVGVVIVSPDQEFPYTTNSNYMFNSLLANAELFSGNIQDQSRATMRLLRSQGRHLGRAPFGYKVSGSLKLPSLFQVPEEAAIVLSAFVKIADGMSQVDVAYWLGQQTVFASKYKGDLKYHQKVLSRWLRMHIYEGMLLSKTGLDPIEGDFEFIVPPTIFAKAQQNIGIGFKPVVSHQKQIDLWFLKNSLLCAKCGSGFTAYYAGRKKHGEKYPRYECRGCREWIGANEAHTKAINKLETFNLNPKFRSELENTVRRLALNEIEVKELRRKELGKLLTELKSKRQRYLDAYVSGKITEDDWTEQSELLKQTQNNYEQELSNSPRLTPEFVNLAVGELNLLLSEPSVCWESTPRELWHELARIYFPQGIVCENKELRTSSFLGIDTRLLGTDTSSTQMAVPAGFEPA